MSIATATLDHELQINGRLTVESFYELAESLAERRSPAGYLSAELKAWRADEYSVTELQNGVQKSLESMLRSLAQWQIRFDGNYEHLQRTLEILESDTAILHVKDTKLAHILVDWCRSFPAVAE